MSKPAYLIAHVMVKDDAQYEKYKVLSSQAIQEYGAEPLVRGGTMDLLEGYAHPRTVVLKFASMAQAQAFYHSPTYTQARMLRQDAAEGDFMIVEGI